MPGRGALDLAAMRAPSWRPLALAASLGCACGDDAASATGDPTSSAATATTSTGQGGDGTTGGMGGNAGTGGAGSGPGSGGAASTTSTGTTAGAGGGCDTVALFDGVDDVIEVAVGGALDAPDGFSVSAWVRPEPLPNGAAAFIAGRHLDGSSNGYYLALLNEAGTLKVRFNVFTGMATCQATAPITLPATGMVHVAGAFDAPEVRVFIDGAPAATEACGDFTAFIEPTSVFSIGRSDTGVLPFEGRIDRVRYGLGALSGTFDPTALSCAAGGELFLDFEGVASTEPSAVPELCSIVAANGVVGAGVGADAADPTFPCD